MKFVVMIRLVLCIFISFFLMSCGGGGDSSDKQPVVTQADFDNDGQPDSQDSDDDNDGYLDTKDDFPFNASEWLDTDSDGTGNNTDTDDDNDGYLDAEDALPLDADEFEDSDGDGVGDNADHYDSDPACYMDSDGDGSVCYLTLLKQLPEQPLIKKSSQFIYFSLASQSKILLLNTENQHFSEAIVYDEYRDLVDFLYHSSHERTYLQFSDGTIKYINAVNEFSDFPITNSGTELLFSAGDYLIISGQGNMSLYDVNAQETASIYLSSELLQTSWDQLSTTLYYTAGNQSRVSYIGSLAIDVIQGTIADQKSRYVSNNDNFQGRFIHLSNDDSLLFSSGSLLSTSSFEHTGDTELAFVDAVNLDDDGWLTIQYIAGKTKLNWFDKRFNVLDEKELLGSPKVIAGQVHNFTIVTETIEHLESFSYVLSDDVDNDGVPNESDEFPADASASVDTDNDGYPDEWNEGYNEADSTIGLEIDSFPNDSACWLLAHGDGTGQCNYGETMPAFTPDQVVAGNDGIIYIFSIENNTVFRWSGTEQRYIQPIYLNSNSTDFHQLPLRMAYSEEHQRIYLGYQNGEIKFVDLTDTDTVHHFTSLPLSVEGLASVGHFVLAQDESGAWASHYIFDINGVQTDIKEWNQNSQVYAWNELNSRVYFLRGTSDLYYEEIDQSSGEIKASKEANSYHGHGSEAIISISSDGSLVILGNGNIYDADTLTWKGAITSLSDAFWLSNNDLVTINKQNNEQFQITRRNSNYTTVELENIAGNFVKMLHAGESTFIVSIVQDELVFSEYIANDDTDGDGVDNLTDAFPLDIASSLDSDNDGFPDTWNQGYSEEDSTTNLALDSFSSDSACWLTEHNDGNGFCDYSATMPSFTPDEVLAGNDGIIYLLHYQLSTIYRWSTQSNSFINPIYVGSSNGLEVTKPMTVEVSSVHQRLYLGYQSGVITYIDLTNISAEKRFTNTGINIRTITSVGDFIRTSAGIFDVNAVNVDDSHAEYSRDYAWNEHNNRSYYFRDGSSPNDLHFVELNPNSGEIIDSGETPYHGSYSIVPPIRISNDGALVLLGSGDLYDANTLNWQGAVNSFDDALWLSNGDLVTINKTGDNSYQLVRRNSALITVENEQYQGSFIRLISAGNSTFIVSKIQDEFIFTEYLSNDDSDGDGVDNLSDAFPMDQAASIDSDNDGFPDQWNEGGNAENSTNGLILDGFPNDSACWLSEHDDGNGQCDFGATLPSFTPAKVISDENGIIYLYNSELGTVYRWSALTENYINPINVAQSNGLLEEYPTRMVYSQAHQRLYFGYESGEITFVDLTDIGPEQRFVNTAMGVQGLVAVGHYILAQDSSGAWNTHYVFDVNGTQTDIKDWNRYSREWAWNEHNSRVYFFSDGTSPNDLHFEEIDQSTGEISDSGETPYHSSSGIRTPIKIIDSGRYVLLGSGNVYDADTMEIEHEMSLNILDAAAFEDIFVVAHYVENESVWSVDTYNNNFSFEDSQTYTGEFVSMKKYQDTLIVVTIENGELSYSLTQLGDGDGDSIPAWWENKYGLSDEDTSDAIEDLDDDGLNNLDEFINRTSPIATDTDIDGLTDLEELNTYNTAPLIADSDVDGLLDGDEVLTYSTDPLVSDTDLDGFSDGEEVLKYNTDPLNSGSAPEPITSMIESFESGLNVAFWASTLESDGDWLLTEEDSSQGDKSIRSGNIGDGQQSSVLYSALFAKGNLTFDAKVSSESCCDRLFVYIDGEMSTQINNGEWQEGITISLSQGEHIIEWRYSKDGSASSGEDAAWIDNIQFIAE